MVGALAHVFSLLSRVLGPVAAIFGGGRVGGLFGSVASSIASIFRSTITAAGRVVSKAVGKIPVEGMLAVLLYVMACNADLIPCNKPTAELRRQFAEMAYTQLMKTMSDNVLYNPNPPPLPPEYVRPKIAPQTAVANVRPMSYVPLSGFNIVHACPWLIKGVAVTPTAVLSYRPSETVVLSRAGTHSGL